MDWEYWEQQHIALYCMGVDCDTGDFRDDWVCAAIDGTWGNDDEACDNDDLHAVFLFGA